MTTLIETSLPSTRRIWWSIGVHATILLLCLVIGSIPPTPASAIERTHLTLVAPSIPKQVPKKTPVAAAKLVTHEPAPARAVREMAREFVPPAAKSSAPPRFSQVEITSLQPLEPVAPVISSAGPITRELPPPPIVVGKLSGATASTAPLQSGVIATRSGFSTSKDAGATPEPKPTRPAVSGFGGAAIANAPLPRASASSAVLTKPVEILKKPQPVYTEEARSLHLEGEVLLEVLFTAAAEVRVLRVIRGLGHGLDESAIASASRIEFRPALREGEPADQNVTVHIRFQLAY